MKSLYFKVLLWFLATVAVTGIGLLWVTWAFGPDRQGPPFRRGIVRQAEAAFRANDTRGREGLAEHLRVLAEVAGVEAAVTDSNGTDLVTGQDRSAQVERLRRLRVVPPIAGVRSRDGRYWFLLPESARPPGPPPIMPAHVWVLVSVGLLSLWLARYITNPVRRLRDAVDGFGAGDLGRRVELRRGDEVGQLAEAFNRMAARVESLVGSQRRLFADLSHELRSPLTRLGLAVELARTAGDNRTALDRIQREADRLNHLVGGLLQLARGEADPGSLPMARLDLDTLVAEIVDSASLDASGKGCQLRLESVPAQVMGDEELLRRAIDNVLRNAVRHAPANSPIDVVVGVAADGCHVVIRDFGPGVAADVLPRLFDAFYRAADTGGIGLGLSIAQKAVQLHHGSIVGENANPGLRVTLRLPSR
jgi:two-component system sensor histidine kinase CpxA